MADNDFQMEEIGEVYAGALIDLADQQHVLGEVTEDVRGLRELVKQDEGLEKFLTAATIGDDVKWESLKKIFEGRIHPLTLNTLGSLARRERLVTLPGFFKAFERILEEKAGNVEVELISSQALPGETVERIRAAVEGALGKHPMMRTRVDESLIGGVRLRVGDTLVDGSVETQLTKMREKIREGSGKAWQGKAGEVLTEK